MKSCSILLLIAMVVGLQSLAQEKNYDHLVTFSNLDEALKDPDQVEKLVLKREKFKSFPKEVYQFNNLVFLDLSRNKIDSIPADIGQMGSLEFLNLNSNKLEHIPDEMGELSALKYLMLGNNELYDVPRTIGKLSNLEHLELWSNYFKILPFEVSDLTQLREVDLRGLQLNSDQQDKMVELFNPSVLVRVSLTCNCD